MRRFNLLPPEFDHSSERDGYRWRGARVGRAVGAEEIGACLYELGDGQRSYPYHFDPGSSALRTGVASFGPEGALTFAEMVAHARAQAQRLTRGN